MLKPSTGDFVFADFKTDLESIIDRGLATALVYGDAGQSRWLFHTKGVGLVTSHKFPLPFLPKATIRVSGHLPHSYVHMSRLVIIIIRGY